MILVISGPSGVGKTVICDRLVKSDSSLVHSISATTRKPRSDEKDGRSYLFWSEEHFRSSVDQGFFLEWAEVHGNLYGTPLDPIVEHLENGRCPVLDVDVQGGRSVKKLRPDAVLILVAPPSMEILEERLRGRGTDEDDVISQRLAHASRELVQWEQYDYVLVNDDLDQAVANAQAMIVAERARVSRRLQGSGGD
jgi:guanylate kinase